MSRLDPFAHQKIRIVFVLCHLFQGLVGVSAELHIQKEHSLILIRKHHLLHLSGKEHVAFVMLWGMIGAAQRSDSLTLVMCTFFVQFMFIPPFPSPVYFLYSVHVYPPTPKRATDSS